MAGLLADKVAVITGGGQGLGLAIAREFGGAGAHVLLVGRTEPVLTAARGQVAAVSGGRVETLLLDVAEPAAGDTLVRTTAALFGAWDILVNSAGAFVFKSFLELSDEDWNRALATNLSAPFRLTRAWVKDLVAKKRGGVVLNIGSVHGAVGDANAVPQCAAKAGLIGLTRAMAEACREHGVRVNAIAPGAIAADSSHRLSVSSEALVTQGDVAQLATYLASDKACCITGTTVDAFGMTRPVIANPGVG
ncbi:MAG TPA: SDR family NAD(P)-dependent oxidoreductase [Myxococcota bacterium]|nr:SDR family NAD(P)-dependent oxidoreductase [Myxococcota bacterium]